MRKTKTGLSVVACLAATVAIAPSAFAQATIIYDNTSQDLGARTSMENPDIGQNREIGDIVTFGAGTTDRSLFQFQFEYFASSGLSGNETAQVFIRSVVNDVTPDAVLFQSPTFSLVSGTKKVTVPGLNTVLPDTVAWTIKFSGFEAGEDAGLLFYNGGTGTVGSNPLFNGSDFMIANNNDGTFALLNTTLNSGSGNVIDNFGVRFTAIPEPSTLALLVGGLAGFGLLRRRNS